MATLVAGVGAMGFWQELKNVTVIEKNICRCPRPNLYQDPKSVTVLGNFVEQQNLFEKWKIEGRSTEIRDLTKLYKIVYKYEDF